MDKNRYGADVKMEIIAGLGKQQQVDQNRYDVGLKTGIFVELGNAGISQI